MKILLLVSILAFCQLSFATTYIVDINGGGQYTSINAAIGIANTNDTVKVWPGTYFEQITLNKNITLMGSGYENTIITGNFNPCITMNYGVVQWFMVSSLLGHGIKISGGIVKNCVLIGCAGAGIYCNSGSGSIINCVALNNAWAGIDADNPGYLVVTNCISRNNSGSGFDGCCGSWSSPRMTLSYSNGSHYVTTGNQGVVDCEPGFTKLPSDLHIAQDPTCSWNTGSPSLLDPDGSFSDMGYFGGPDCPIYPVVTQILINPNAVGTINLQAKARANY